MSDDDSLEKHIQLDGRELNALPEMSSPDDPLPIGPVKQFCRDLILVLTEPSIFFKTRYPETSFTYALAFGITVAWIATFLSWLTRIVRHETLLDGFLKMREKLQELPFWKNIPDSFWAQNTPQSSQILPTWLAEIFGIVLSPFQALISLTLSGVLIFLGCFLLVPKTDPAMGDSVELKNTIKLVAFASSPILISAILGFLPFNFGAGIGWIYTLVLTVLALSIRFHVSTPRSFAIVVLPGIVTLMTLGCVIGLIAGVFFGLIASFFHT